METGAFAEPYDVACSCLVLAIQSIELIYMFRRTE